jgi:hypothetical protein
MPRTDAKKNMTEQQRKWFASVRDGLERDTGKSLADWVVIAKTCPASKPRDRLKWFKEKHGLLQNRASYVLSVAFPGPPGWDEPDTLKGALWTEASSREILDAVEKLVLAMPEVIPTQRKGYSAWSRKYQFAALRPVRGGMARLGLAISPETDPSLLEAKNEGWSERLKASMVLESPGSVDRRVAKFLRAAWSAS